MLYGKDFEPCTLGPNLQKKFARVGKETSFGLFKIIEPDLHFGGEAR